MLYAVRARQLLLRRVHTVRNLLYTLPGGDPSMRLQIASLRMDTMGINPSGASMQPGMQWHEAAHQQAG